MNSRLVASILAAIIIASGAVGSFYFVQAQAPGVQTQKPLLLVTPSTGVAPGGSVNVNGTNFSHLSSVAVSLGKVISNTTLQSGKAYLIQTSQNSSTSIGSTSTSSTSGNENIIGKALGTLSSLFGFGSSNTTTNTTTGTSGVTNSITPVPLNLVFQNQSMAEKVSLVCQNSTLAKSNVSPSGTTVLPVSSSSLSGNCVVSATSVGATSTDNSTLSIPSTAQAGTNLFTSKVKTNNGGSFAVQVPLPTVASGTYGILAVGASVNETAFSTFSISPSTTSPPPVVQPTQPANQTLTTNQTAPTNVTTPSPSTTTTTSNASSTSTSNVTSSQTTSQNTSSTANVQVSENEVRPGSPVAISGSGFSPQTPVQVFINNIQITNIITNIHGSFDSVVIVPTTVNSGTANVVVKSKQTNISHGLTVVSPSTSTPLHTTVTFNAVIAGSGAQPLTGVPVSVINTNNGQMVTKGKTPLEIQDLAVGTYSVFYSDVSNYVFASAAPGKWSDTNNGGAGIITVSGLKDLTVTALFEPRPTPPPAPQPIKSSMTLHSVDSSGNALPGMFVTVYSTDASQIIGQGFTDLQVTDLLPGTYPIFFANFGSSVFASASPGTWVQTPYGGAGLVTIADDGVSHSITVTAVYQTSQTTIASQPQIQAPFSLNGNIFTITSNTTQPSGPYDISGTFHLQVNSDKPANATLSAYLVSANDDANPNVSLDSQSSRDHHTIQILHLTPDAAGPVGSLSYVVTGTADILVDGTMYSSGEKVQIMVSGGQDLSPTNIQITFQGSGTNSGAARFGTLYGAADLGIK